MELLVVAIILFLVISIPVTAILVYAGLVYAVLFLITYSPKKEFNRTTWMNEKNIRYQMVDDLVKTKLLVNSDTNTVKQVIGEPSSRDSSNTQWEYNLGMGGGGLGFLLHFLNIKFQNNKVVEVQHFEVPD